MIEDNDELLRLFEEILKNQQASFIDKFKKVIKIMRFILILEKNL